MSEIFGFSEYSEYDLYHARYGRGAVIVAVKKQPLNGRKPGTINSDMHVAKIFSSREQSLDNSSQQLDPIHSIEEIDGIVKVVIHFERRHSSNPSYNPMSAIVERRIPFSQVTFEIVKENGS